MHKNFLIYVTANDDPNYLIDYLNFYQMVRLDAGVKEIQLFLVISAVEPFSIKDQKIVGELIKIVEKSSQITVKKVVFKGNTGRDFSSTEAALNEVAAFADEDDWIMVKNRSGYGPLSEYWYSEYIHQFEIKDNIGLIGSTIKLTGHPKHKSDGLDIHVQTYVYLTRWNIISQFINNFPGSPSKDRLSVIVNGEIKLSRTLMEKGYGLTCLYWPDHIFYQHTTSIVSGLPQNDVKKIAYNVPIRYKFARYTRNWKAIILITMWKCRIVKKRKRFANENFVFTERYGKITK